MHHAISSRSRLGASLSLFAAVGALSAVGSAIGTVVSTVLAVGGIYLLAGYANRISRPRLAAEALVLWLSFLAVAGIHAIGTVTVASFVPVSASAATIAVSMLTWMTLLAATSSTVFLGFREYGATPTADPHDDGVFDGDSIR